MNNNINQILEEFAQISNNSERLVFEQKFSTLLLTLNQEEKDSLFQQFFEITLNNLKNVGDDLDKNQLLQIEQVLSLGSLSSAA